MAADQLSVQWIDAFNGVTTLAFNVQGGLGPTNVDLIAAIQAWRNMSQAQITSAKLIQSIDISGLTNPIPTTTGSLDRVRMQVIMQARREDNTGFVRMTVPAPIDSILEQTGAFAQQDVNPVDPFVLAFINAALDDPGPVTAGEIWVSPQDSGIDFDKGWLKGQPHS